MTMGLENNVYEGIVLWLRETFPHLEPGWTSPSFTRFNSNGWFVVLVHENLEIVVRDEPGSHRYLLNDFFHPDSSKFLNNIFRPR